MFAAFSEANDVPDVLLEVHKNSLKAIHFFAAKEVVNALHVQSDRGVVQAQVEGKITDVIMVLQGNSLRSNTVVLRCGLEIGYLRASLVPP